MSSCERLLRRSSDVPVDPSSGEDGLVGGNQWIAPLPPAASRGPEVSKQQKPLLRRAPASSEDGANKQNKPQQSSLGFTHLF